MSKQTDPWVKEIKDETKGTIENTKGLLKRASDFVSRHIKRGERLLEKEKLQHEYDLDDYMNQYRPAFDSSGDFDAAKSRVMDNLIDEYLQDNPDRSRYTFKSDYLEGRIDDLFAQEIAHYTKKERLKDIFEP